MDLYTSLPYPLFRHGAISSYPSLHENINTGITIMGAGITGALVAWYLTQAGSKCVVVDKRHVATGSTAASTSLIQYEIDTPLHQLVKKVGYEHAVRSYKLCLQSINTLKTICNKISSKEIFENKCSLQLASHKKDVRALEKEFELRKSLDFDVELLESSQLQSKFTLKKEVGILSKNAAQVDAYLITHKLLQRIEESGNKVYDHTEIVNIDHQKKGVVLKTREGYTVTSKKLIIACGYESQRYLSKKVEDIFTTYVILTEPLRQKKLWYGNCLIWETANPYLYMRITNENRILIGGKDTPYRFRDPFSLLNQKAIDLQKSFKKLFPHIHCKIDFKWAGAFATTKDGLPYIGCVPERPNTYFALGFGGNGITFSVIAAQIITNLINGKNDEDAYLFSFDR